MDGRYKLIFDAMKGIEKTIPELLEIYGISELPLLDSVIQLGRLLEEAGLESDPPLNKGDVEDVRVISIQATQFGSHYIDDIYKEESIDLEFKSTFLYDVKQGEARPGVPPRELSDVDVIKSVLKTICAFLNAQGGVLYIGVTNDKEIFGLEMDYECLAPPSGFDPWELKLRGEIEGKITDGKQIQSYIKVHPIDLKGKTVARVEVTRRRRESFLKTGKACEFFIRTGNRTDNIKIEDLPEVIRKRDEDYSDQNE